MAKAPTPATPVAVTLADLAAAGDAGLMLTQAQGAEFVVAGFATVDTSVTDASNPDAPTAKVTITDAGKASLAPTSPAFAIETGFTPPTTRTRKSKNGGYPFDALEVGQSFHVPAKTVGERVSNRLASALSVAKQKYGTPTGATEMRKVSVFSKDAAGKFIHDAAGKRVVVSTSEKEVPVMAYSREFTVWEVDATDPRGAGARCIRTK